MQYILTQEELDALKVKTGVPRAKINEAMKELREDMLNLIREVVNHKYDIYPDRNTMESPLVKSMRTKLQRFEQRLNDIPESK